VLLPAETPPPRPAQALPAQAPASQAVPPAAAPAVQAAPLPAPAPQPPRPAPAPPAPVSPSVVVDRTALAQGQGRSDGTGYALAFLPGTTTLAATDRAVIARLAGRGPGVTYRVTGFGDASGAGRELDLPLARARAVADALRAAGAPAEAIELGGEARPGPAGRGAEIRLVYRP
jgi:outer membrane protein OmpA-like peptidoglycan-associated protein